MYFWVSSGPDAIKVKAERATGKNPNNWIVLFDRNDYGMTGWSGNDYISFSQGVFGGGKNQTGNYWNYRLTFMTCGPNGSSTLSGISSEQAQNIAEIRGYGTTWWTAGNKFASSDHMYSWDINKNVTFPAKVTAASGFSGSGASLTNLNANNISSGTVPVARLPVATSSADGIMTSTEKNKLAGITEQATKNTDADIVDLVYPVGAIYMSTVQTSPATLFSGTTWDYISTSAKTVNELKAQPAQIISTASTVTQLKAQEAIIAGMIGVYAWKRTS